MNNDINRPKSFRTVSPSPEGEGWDKGINRMQEFMERLIQQYKSTVCNYHNEFSPFLDLL